MATQLPVDKIALPLLYSLQDASPNYIAHRSLFPKTSAAACQAVVVIPVRNECSTLAQTIDALAHQVDREGKALDPALYDVLVLINNTTDGSALVAREMVKRHPSLSLHVAEIDLPEPHAHVGQARRILMDAACDRLVQLDRHRGVIATTDADTIVSPTWLSATLEAIEQGADAVGGRILVSRDDLRAMDPDARLYHLQDVGYRYLLSQLEAAIDPPPGDPWPRHFQHFGASVAVTAEMYRLAGGLPVRSSLEDVAFYHQLVAVDAVVRHSPDVRVYTSARSIGRTEFGFAIQLQQWSEMKRRGECLLVRSPEDMVDEFRARRALRETWRLRSVGSLESQTRLAKASSVCPDRILELAQRQSHFGLAWQSLRAELQESSRRSQQFPPVEIGTAIRNLRLLLSQYPLVWNTSPALKDIQSVERLPPVEQMV